MRYGTLATVAALLLAGGCDGDDPTRGYDEKGDAPETPPSADPDSGLPETVAPNGDTSGEGDDAAGPGSDAGIEEPTCTDNGCLGAPCESDSEMTPMLQSLTVHWTKS